MRPEFGVKAAMRMALNSVSLRTLTAVLLLLALAGCGLFESRQSRALRRLPEYREGYDDGCFSAQDRDANMREAAPSRRDEQMFEGNRAYRTGWNSGFGACRARYGQPQDAARPEERPGPAPILGGGGVP
jgi:hypothetical protein